MKLIEVKTPKATLLLTEDEYLAALKRGKAIKRSRELKRRLEPKDNQAFTGAPLNSLISLISQTVEGKP